MQRVPQWTDVTVTSTGTLTANAWDGTSGGVLVFRASGTVDINPSGSIHMNAKGYQGGAAGATDGGANGESYDDSIGKGGADLGAGTDGGGAGRNNGTNSSGTRGGGGGGGYDGAGATEAGGGGASGDGSSNSSSGGLGGIIDVAGGGGGCAPGDNAGSTGADAGNSAADAGTGADLCTGGAVGSGANKEITGEGGSSTSPGGDADAGGGGGGGGLYGEKTLATIFLGSGGGGSGDSNEKPATPGTPPAGGNGGGIIFIMADTVTNSGTLSSNGAAGTAGGPDTDPFGGSGVSIMVQANTFTNSATFTASGGAGGAVGGTGSAGSGAGGGGVGRIRIEVDSPTLGTITPAASTPGSDATFTLAQDVALTGLTKHTIKRLRFEISNEGELASGSVLYRLEVSQANPASCDDTGNTWTRVDTSTAWNMTASADFNDGNSTSNIDPGLFDENTNFVAGELKDTTDQINSGIILNNDEFTEIEYALAAANSATGGGDLLLPPGRRRGCARHNQLWHLWRSHAGGGPTLWFPEGDHYRRVEILPELYGDSYRFSNPLQGARS